jgi:UDP-glucose 4-epimerase
MILITGGTGSFGHAYARAHRHERVRILSRDEEKQRAMALEFPTFDYVIGDIRDRDAVEYAMRGVQRVFHAAALKQVPPLEAAPMEAVKTNVVGTDNVCRAAKAAHARVVTISTDKAVEPVGVMGASKFMAESITTGHGFNVVRYGNVLGSRGSILPIWRDAMKRGEPVRITDPTMTRFVITLDEAIELIDYAMGSYMSGTIYVKRSPAATVRQFARVVAGDHPTEIVGIRPGEKRHEHLVVPDEAASEAGDYFAIRRGGAPTGIRYSSETAPRMTDDELRALIEVSA